MPININHYINNNNNINHYINNHKKEDIRTPIPRLGGIAAMNTPVAHQFLQQIQALPNAGDRPQQQPINNRINHFQQQAAPNLAYLFNPQERQALPEANGPQQQAAPDINLNVHDEVLNGSTNGYPAIFDSVSAQVKSNSSAINTKKQMLDAGKHQVTRSTLKANGDAEKVRKANDHAEKAQKAISYMLDSSAAGAPIMEYPRHILLKNVLIKTWDFIAENTTNDNGQREKAIEVLFEQLAEASVALRGNTPACNTGHASRTLQALPFIFPDKFNEPLSFEESRDSMQKFSKALVLDIIKEQAIPVTQAQPEFTDEQIAQIKEGFTAVFHSKVEEQQPNIPTEYITRFMEDFIEPAFETLVDQAFET